jgi:hypothetical protein
VDLYRTLFGGIATGDVKRKFEARSRVFDEIEALAGRAGRSLPAADAERFGSYTGGFREMNGLREKLVGVADHLRKFAPDYGRKFTHPEFETDWHDSLLEIGIATLKSGLTNVLTIGSGRGEIFGAWKGLGVTETGHNLGHMKQPDNDIWIKIRQYNSRMLARLIDELESMPEPDGAGTMMDNTVIVYSSNNADKQHSNGANWPFVLIGSRKGVIQTGRFTQLDGRRPVNALYTTLLHAIGKPADRFNMDKGTAAKLDSKVGPIESLLA